MNNCKSLIVEVSKRILNDEMDWIEGCRKINQMRSQLEEAEDDIFSIFILIDSETDEYIVKPFKKLYSENYLKRTDLDTQNYLEDMQEELKEACRVLIHRYSKKS